MSKPLDDVLTAIGGERHSVGRNGVYDVAVSCQDGKTIALFRRKSFRLTGHVVDEG
jgi:acyl-CoA thioesterase